MNPASMATTDEILDVIRADIEARHTECGFGMTGPEIARALGCDILKARAHVRRLIEEGRMEVTPLERRRLDGKRARVYGYRVVE